SRVSEYHWECGDTSGRRRPPLGPVRGTHGPVVTSISAASAGKQSKTTRVVDKSMCPVNPRRREGATRDCGCRARSAGVLDEPQDPSPGIVALVLVLDERAVEERVGAPSYTTISFRTPTPSSAARNFSIDS